MKRNFYNIRDSYVVYENMSDRPISINQYIEICKRFMKFLFSELLDKGEITIPERLGKLLIFGKKIKVVIEDNQIKGLAPDWAETKKLWEKDLEARQNKQLVYHFNEDTNGVRYKIFWSKNRVLVSNKTLYNLRMTRTNKRTLASLVKEGKEYLIKD